MDAFWRACWRQILPSPRRCRLQPSHAHGFSSSAAAPRPASVFACIMPTPEWKPSGSYDLIVSHFFLDCFFPQQLEQLFAGVLPYALPGAQWVISEFAIPPNAFAAYLARGIVGLLYRAFGLLTGLPVRALPDYANPLLRRGLALTHDRRYLAGLLCSQIWTKPPCAKML